jgi:hypothetical protein
VFGPFLVDHHPALDALEVLDDAPVPCPELSVNEEPGPIASETVVAEPLDESSYRVTSQARSVRE